jgi:hypothetical protein
MPPLQTMTPCPPLISTNLPEPIPFLARPQLIRSHPLRCGN